MLENPMVSGYGFKDYLNCIPLIAFNCDECGEPIYEGDRYLSICRQRICEGCADSNWETAEIEEECMDFEEENTDETDCND